MKTNKNVAWDNMIFATVYEIQWGNGLPATYKRYFESMEAIEEFKTETGFKVEVEI